MLLENVEEKINKMNKKKIKEKYKDWQINKLN